MAAFLGDIAFLSGILVAAAGLLVLHRAGGDPRPALLKTAGVVLLVGGAGTAVCTSYYYLKYHFAGDLDHPFPISSASMPMMMNRGAMGMGGGGMPSNAATPESAGPAAGAAAPGASDAEHAAHHPGVRDDGPQ